jgi:hypothetical protein
LNAKGKHVTALVRAKRRDLKTLTRNILEQKAAAEAQKQQVEEQAEKWVPGSAVLLEEFGMGVSLNQEWEAPNYELEGRWDRNVRQGLDQGFNLEPVGDP